MKIHLRNILIYAIQSFFSSWAIMKASHMEPGNIFTLIFFLFCFLFFRYANERAEKSGFYGSRTFTWTCAVISVFFTIFYLSVDYPRYIETLTNPLFQTGIIIATAGGYLFLFYYLLKFLFSYAANTKSVNHILFTESVAQRSLSDEHIADNSSGRSGNIRRKLYSFYYIHTGLCAFLLCMFCWFPYFLYQYPGIMTPDSVNQFEQVLGLIPYNNHHPWVHTLLIGLIYNLGYKLTKSMLVALSFYTFFQMCLLAGSVCYFINTLKRFCLKPGICFAITLFYALIPYHAVFSVTIWKDIPFAAAVMLFGCALFRLLFEKPEETDINISSSGKQLSGKKSRMSHGFSTLCIFIITGIMLCLFRSNGWYAFLLCFPFLLFSFRKKAKTMFPALFGILLTAVIIKYPVMNTFHVTPPDFAESLSIPIQQITAVICNDRVLTQEELELIENVVDLTYIKKLYDPHYADNIKNLVRAGNLEYLAKHKKEFFILWAKLGLRYPGDYLTAYIQQTYGYWYPDSFYLVAEAEGISATSLGVSHTPLIRGPLVVKAKEISIKLGGMIPLYGTLWSMGVACWILIFCIGNVFVRREKKKLILYLPSIALLLTVLIATPVATEFRYVYFMVFGMPFYLMTSLIPSSGT